MISPKRNTQRLVFLFAFVMAFSAFAAMAPMAEAADNEAPVWSLGDGVALHLSMDFMSIYNAEQDKLTDTMEEILADEFGDDVTITDFSVTKASMNSALMLEVTSVTSATYTVVQTAAFELKFAASASWIILLPDAGSYANESAALLTAHNKSMSGSFDITTGFVETITMVMEKDTMALKSVSISLRPAASLSISVTNAPDIDYEEYYNVSYGNINLKFITDVRFTASAGFAPSFNLFNLPEPDADSWSSETENVTINAGLTGMIDFSVTGNHPKVKEMNDGMTEFFGNVPANVTGVTAFPINMASVSIPAADINESFPFNITNGAIPQQVIPIPQFEMGATGTTSENITGFFEDNFTVYWVGSEAFDQDEETTGMLFTGDGPSGIPYSATLLNLSQWSDILDVKAEEMLTEIDAMMLDATGINMTGSVQFASISTAAANDVVNSISQTVNSITDDGGFDIVGFFLDSPYYGIIALVGIVVVVAILTRRG